LGTTAINQNFIREGIKSRLNSGNARHYAVQNLLSSRLLPKNVKIKIYKTIILPTVLYGYETWSLTICEKHRLRVFENRVLRRVFGPKRDEVTEGWRNVELHSMYSSPNIITMIKSRRMRWTQHVACMKEMRNAYDTLVRKSEGKRPPERPRRREDNIKIYLKDSVKRCGLDSAGSG
jgi:hypothetical protein